VRGEGTPARRGSVERVESRSESRVTPGGGAARAARVAGAELAAERMERNRPPVFHG
jgi:hypothetical protein